MRKFVIALATAGAALAVATPAAAQYYPQPQPYGYGAQPYGYNGYGTVRALQSRIDGIQNQIRWLDRRNAIGDRSADRLREESRSIERRLHNASRYGLNPYELNDIQRRVQRLEQRVQMAMNYRGGRYGGYNQSGYNGYHGDRDGYYSDHDRDGRDDRYEDDHGRDRDD
jgi:opacity protein-like surface antigen